MCENTLAAMRQVVTAMQEEGTMFLNDMSRDERRHFEAMFDMCEAFMTLTEELEYEERQERDGQPDEAQEWHDFDPDC
jgi:hypothetical protein